MGDRRIKTIEFEPRALKALEDFLEVHPTYKGMIQARLDDLLNFPELAWQSVFLESEDLGHFYTRNQQIELAGKAYQDGQRILITHFRFHS